MSARVDGPGALTARARKLLRKSGWNHPAILVPASRTVIVEDAETRTASIDDRDVIRLGSDFCGKLSDSELTAVLWHENLHMAMLHRARFAAVDGNPENHLAWNVACDRAINGFIRSIGFKLPEGCYYPGAGQEAMSAEQMYVVEKKRRADAKKDGQGPPAPGEGGFGKGCGVERSPEGGPSAGKPGAGRPQPGGSDASGGPGEAPSTGSGRTQSQRERASRSIAAEMAAVAKSCGSGAGDVLAKLLEPPPALPSVSQVLRKCVSMAAPESGRRAQTYTRASRRSVPVDGAEDRAILPGWMSMKAAVAAVFDVSGSMPDSALNAAARDLIAMTKTAAARIYVVVHDDGVRWSGWVLPTTKHADLVARFTGRGGTSFEEAYERVGEARAKFDVMVHFTDGECWRWPARPANARRLFVGLYGSRSRASVPSDATVIETEAEAA